MNATQTATSTQEKATATLFPDLLEPEELASALRISQRKLARLEQHRQGPPRIVIGRRIFYARSSVQEWLKEREERRKGRR